VGEVPVGDHFSGVLVLGVEGVVGELDVFVQVLIAELEPVDEVGVNCHQLGQQLVVLLKVDAALPLADPLELHHQHLLGDQLVEHPVGLGVDQQLPYRHRGGLLLELVEGLPAAYLHLVLAVAQKGQPRVLLYKVRAYRKLHPFGRRVELVLLLRDGLSSCPLPDRILSFGPLFFFRLLFAFLFRPALPLYLALTGHHFLLFDLHAEVGLLPALVLVVFILRVVLDVEYFVVLDAPQQQFYGLVGSERFPYFGWVLRDVVVDVFFERAVDFVADFGVLLVLADAEDVVDEVDECFHRHRSERWAGEAFEVVRVLLPDEFLVVGEVALELAQVLLFAHLNLLRSVGDYK
jgi:hypothetical protein